VRPAKDRLQIEENPIDILPLIRKFGSRREAIRAGDEAIILVTDLATAILLLSHFAGWRALLLLANGCPGPAKAKL
jgi:hypothetical protein